MKKATEMTHIELSAAARNYDNIVNEGGEGYNPYQSEIDRRDHEAIINRPKTKQDKIDTLYRQINRECGSVAREWSNNEAIDAKQSKIHDEINRLKAEVNAEFLSVWSIDVTQTRRKSWNDMVKDGKFSIDSKRVDFQAMHNQEKTQGWTLDELRGAVKLHNLK